MCWACLSYRLSIKSVNLLLEFEVSATMETLHARQDKEPVAEDLFDTTSDRLCYVERTPGALLIMNTQKRTRQSLTSAPAPKINMHFNR